MIGFLPYVMTRFIAKMNKKFLEELIAYFP
jgi:hypothetical protein